MRKTSGIRKEPPRTKTRYLDAQPSILSNYKENSKFIPFFTNGANTNDWRIAYFIAHLRDEVNRHKGSNMSYRPAKRVIRTINANPHLEKTRELLRAAGKASLMNLITGVTSKKLFEIDYIGNIRFLTIPSSMMEDSGLHEEWVQFFCDLRVYISTPSNVLNNPGALAFVKSLSTSATTTPNELYEYKFAVAVVQTFLATLEDARGVDVLKEPDKWKDATSGTFITPDEMIYLLFAPGKIYGQKTIKANIPTLRANVTNKYYITQRGGDTNPMIAQTVVNAINDIFSVMDPNVSILQRGANTRPTTIIYDDRQNTLSTDYNKVFTAFGVIKDPKNNLNDIYAQLNTYAGKLATAGDTALQTVLLSTNNIIKSLYDIADMMVTLPNYATFKKLVEDADGAGGEVEYTQLYDAFEELGKYDIANQLRGVLNFYSTNFVSIVAAATTASNPGEQTLLDALTAAIGQAIAQEATLNAQLTTLTTQLNALQASGTADAATIARLNADILALQTVAAGAGAPGGAGGLSAADLQAIQLQIQNVNAGLDTRIATALTPIINGAVNETRILTAIKDLVTEFNSQLNRIDITMETLDDEEYLQIDSLPTTPLFETLSTKCIGHTGVSSARVFNNGNLEKFFRKRLNLLFKEADEEIKRGKKKLPSDTSGSIAKTFKDSGITITGENRYTYERVNGKMKITDTITGEILTKKDYEKDYMCTATGFTDTNNCQNFIDQCILGSDIAACATYLNSANFWATDVANFRRNANFYAVYISLKQYKMNLETIGGISKLEDIDVWAARTATVIGSSVNPGLLALLRVAVEQINKHPAIINPHVTGKAINSVETEDNADLIFNKLHPNTQKKLPKPQKSHESLTGVIHTVDILVEKSQKEMDTIRTLIKEGFEIVNMDLVELKRSLEAPSMRSKYVQPQSGGLEPGKRDLNSFKHFDGVNKLREELENIEQRISNYLLQEFNSNISELNAGGTTIATANLNKIKEELMKVKRIEILTKTVAYYSKKFLLFFNSEFTPFINIVEKSLNPNYEPIILNVERTLGELFELVDSTMDKLNNYCKSGGKIESIAKICHQLEKLATPSITEEYTKEFRPTLLKD